MCIDTGGFDLRIGEDIFETQTAASTLRDKAQKHSNYQLDIKNTNDFRELKISLVPDFICTDISI